MKLAVNYCPEIVELSTEGLVSFDLLKCPAWPDLIAIAQGTAPVYVHLPLAVGWGAGDALDTERHRPPDWDAIALLLAQTATPLVNLHLAPAKVLCSVAPGAAVVDRLIADVGSVVDRIGAGRVALENDYESVGEYDNPALQPAVFCDVLDGTGAGLLLDLAHARIAAARLGVDAKVYIEGLPTDRLREIHVSGVQPLEPSWADRIRSAGVDSAEIESFLGRTVQGLCDHLPLTADDWHLAEWALDRIRLGLWSQPWVVSLEYGGIGPWFAPVTCRDVLARTVPRLRELIGSS